MFRRLDKFDGVILFGWGKGGGEGERGVLAHCVICQEQDNVDRRVLHCVINRICKSAEARGDGVSFFRKAARKSIGLNSH